MTHKFERYINYFLFFFIVFMLFRALIYNLEIKSIENNPDFVVGEIEKVSPHTNAVVVYFNYTYDDIKYSNKQTVVYTEYKQLKRASNRVLIILDKEDPITSRILFQKDEFAKYDIPQKLLLEL